MNRSRNSAAGRRFAGTALAVVFAAIGGVCLVRAMAAGIWSFPFGDEDMHVVGARVLNAGGMLYRDFIDLHGPLIFALLQLYGHMLGWATPNHTRLIIAAAVLVAVLALCCGPAVSGRRARALAGGLFAAVLAAVWIRQGLNLTSFYPLAGALAVFSLGPVFGAWRGAPPAAGWSFAAGVSLALLCATAYSFAPSALCFGLSFAMAAWRQGQRRPVIAALAGAAAGGGAVLIWMWRFTDLHGYLAFHILESQIYYPPYIGFSLDTFLRSLVPHLAPEHRIQGLAVIATGAALLGFLALDARRPRHAVEILLGFAGILALNARGMPIFQDGAFLIAALAAFAVASARLAERLPAPALAAPALAAGLAIAITQYTRPALVTPFGLSAKTLRHLPKITIGTRSEGPGFRRIRAAVYPGEHMLALNYAPGTYLQADRLPIPGFYTYFPWDADYARGPFLGRKRDLCVTLAASPPPVITDNNIPIWGFDPHKYMPCLFTALAEKYVRLADVKAGNDTIYVRRDRIPQPRPR